MSPCKIIIIFQKGSKWVGEVYPAFDKESQQKALGRNWAKFQKLIEKAEKVLNVTGKGLRD